MRLHVKEINQLLLLPTAEAVDFLLKTIIENLDGGDWLRLHPAPRVLDEHKIIEDLHRIRIDAALIANPPTASKGVSV